jgi:hypothetical protein
MTKSRQRNSARCKLQIAIEQLAEIGAVFLCADLSITLETCEDQAA